MASCTAQYWERLLRRIPARRFPEPAEHAAGAQLPVPLRLAGGSPRDPGHRRAHQTSSTSSVLLAALAVGMARATGVNPLVPRVYVSNRFRPRLADAVSPIAQTCPVVIDVAGITFDEAVRRAYYASLSAFKHAYFEPARIRELVAAVSEERGEHVDVDFVCNDIRLPSRAERRRTRSSAARPRGRAAADHADVRRAGRRRRSVQLHLP